MERSLSVSRPARPAAAVALRALQARLRAVPDPPAIPSTLVDAIADIFGGPPVVLLLPDATRGAYALAAAHGWAADADRAVVDEAALPGALRALLAAGPDAAPAPLRLRRALPGLPGFQPALAVGLPGEAGPAGLLLLGRRPEGRPYRAADLALLGALADPAAAALRALEGERGHTRAQQQLQTLHDLGVELSANLDVEEVCRTVYEQLRPALEFDSFIVVRYDETIGMLTFPFGADEGERYTLAPVRLGAGLTGWVFETGRPLVIDDLTLGVAHLGIGYKPDTYGSSRRSRSWMGVPMLAKRRTVGVLAVQSYTPHLYSQEQVQFLSTVANQVAGALENASLFRATGTALTTRVAELSALEEIARLLNASLDLDRIINLVLARAVETTGAASGIMALFDPATQGLRLLGQIGCSPDVIERYVTHPLPISQGIIGRAVRENRSLLVRDVTTDPDYIAVAPDVRSQLVALVRRGGQVLGALSLECGEVDGFSQEDVDFAEHLAEHAAIAVDNARRYERERRQNEVLTRRAAELAGILRIGNALKADLALADVLSQIAEGVRASLGFNIAVLNLVQDGPPAVLVRVAAAGLDAATWARLQAQAPTVEEAGRLLDPRFQISESYFISHLYNPATDLPWYYRQPRPPRPDQEWQPDDMLIVPLRGKGGRLVGTLSVDDPTDGQLPSRATIETLEIFANQAVIAIENARLFDEQRERLRELTLLQDLGVRISAKLDPAELLQEVACAAVRLFDVRAAAVYLSEDPANLRGATDAVACSREGDALIARRYPRERLAALSEEALAGATPLLIPDTAADARLGPRFAALGFRALVAAPLYAGARPQGVLYLLGEGAPVFQERPHQLLQIFATQAAVAVQNARLFEEEARRVSDVTSLHDVGLRLTATLDITTLLQESVRLAIRLLDASSSGVLLLDASGTRAVNVRAWSRAEGALEFATYTSDVRPGGLTDTVMRTGQPLTIAETVGDPRINPVTLAEGIRSLVAVPIRVTDTSLGVLFVNGYQPRAFASHEQQLLQVFANQVAVAIQNARLFEERRAFEQRLVADNDRMARELVTARATQRQLLPEMPRRAAGLALHALCLPAMEVGGDYFDVLPLPDGRLALALGDVTGKGTSAVMLMAMIKTALLAQVSADPEPGAVLLALNALAMELMQGQLMTFFYAVYDPATRTLSYANAGHLYPYIRRAAGRLESIGTGGLPLGAYGLLPHAPATASLAPGDLLVIFSDGIVEATDANRQLFGFDRLEEMLRRLDPRTEPLLLVEDVVDRVHTFAGGAPQDDVTLLIARVEPDAPSAQAG
jgi:GAF domain-containing protein